MNTDHVTNAWPIFRPSFPGSLLLSLLNKAAQGLTHSMSVLLGTMDLSSDHQLSLVAKLVRNLPAMWETRV